MAPPDEPPTELSASQLRCVEHDAPTLLKCASCDTPLCPRCAVFTDVGQKCGDCTGRPKQRRGARAVPTVMALLAVLAFLGGGLYLGSDAFQSSSVSTGPTSTVPTVGIGDEVADRGLTYVVRSFECGATEVGSGERTMTANGRYCFLDLRVSNTGNDPASFPGGQQFLFDSANRRYIADFAATLIHAPPEAETSFIRMQLNPGGRFEGVLVYDVAEGATVEHAELHTGTAGASPSLFGRTVGGARGVRVRLDRRV